MKAAAMKLGLLTLPSPPLKLNSNPSNSSFPQIKTLKIYSKPRINFTQFSIFASSENNNNNNNGNGENIDDDEEKKQQREKGLNGNGDGEKGNGRPRLNLKWIDLLIDPDPDNVVAVGLTGVLAWASVTVLWQLFSISIAIVLAALKYSFIAALLIFILITLL